MGMEMNNEIGIPCVLQWCMLRFSLPVVIRLSALTEAFVRQSAKQFSVGM